MDPSEFIVRFAQVHETFRKPELEAVAQLLAIKLDIIEYDDEIPFCIVHLPSIKAAHTLASRCILVDSICELWGQGTNYDTLHADVKQRTHHWWALYKTSSFRFHISGFLGHRKRSESTQLIEGFKYMDFKGPIQMKDAQDEFLVMEQWPRKRSPKGNIVNVHGAKEPEYLYFGRVVGRGYREAGERYSLKKREYINTTSMDAELSLVTANLAQAAPGRIIMDPFAGTGSFCIAAAHFGALSIGADIDGRVLRGSSVDKNIAANFEQYGLRSGWAGAIASDLTNTPFRKGAGNRWVDAIICDPPYGVRESCKVLGTKKKMDENAMVDGELSHSRPDYVPPKQMYSFDAMISDILFFAAEILVDHGRLAMWMPTANEDCTELSIPQSTYLDLSSVSVQTFTKWSRRLMIYVRKPDIETGVPVKRTMTAHSGTTADDLNDFRRKVWMVREGRVQSAANMYSILRDSNPAEDHIWPRVIRGIVDTLNGSLR